MDSPSTSVNVNQLSYGDAIKVPGSEGIRTYIGHSSFSSMGKERIRVHVAEGPSLGFDIAPGDKVEKITTESI